jgi:hypothetical protein
MQLSTVLRRIFHLEAKHMQEDLKTQDMVIMETKPDPKTVAISALADARADLVACEGEITKAEGEKAAAEAGIPSAPDTAKATELIRQVQASEALVVSYLRPKRERLVAALEQAQAVVTHLEKQARMEQLVIERFGNQTALAAADISVKATMLDLSAKAIEVAGRYALLTAQMQELQSLQAAGCVAPPTGEMPAIQTVDEIITELARFGTLDWRPTVDMVGKLTKAPQWKDGDK